MQLPRPAAIAEIYNQELLSLHRGQGMDLFWRDSLSTPTEEEYIDMISNKTGGLFRLIVRLMQELSAVDMDLVPIANLLGIIFQIQDDYKNLASESVGLESPRLCCMHSLTARSISSRWQVPKGIATI